MEPPNLVELVKEAISRLEENETHLRVYENQCRAMVHEFVHVRDNLHNLVGGADGEFADNRMKELFGLACEAERVLRRCCWEDSVPELERRWVQAVMLTSNHGPNWSIFETLREDLNWCFEIFRANLVDSSTVEALTHTDRESIFVSDQKSLRKLLENIARTGNEEEKLTANFLLARPEVKHGQVLDARRSFGESSSRGNQQLNCRFIPLLDCLQLPTRGNVSTVLSLYRIEGDVLGVCNIFERGRVTSVTPNLGWRGIQVAEKAFKNESGNPTIRRAWANEICIMARLNHPNVVKFIGCSEGTGFKGPAIIMESEEMSLQEYIDNLEARERERRVQRSQSPAEEGIILGLLFDRVVVVDILMQIASGMAYLHSQDVAHLDLKPANLLVSELDSSCTNHKYLRVKICDFGHSIQLKGVPGKVLNPFGANHGTTIFLAPELFNRGGRVCMKAADVCSFGFTCWAILHSCEPRLHDFSLTGEYSEYYQALVRGIRLNFDESIREQFPAEFIDLIELCWDTNPAKRPTFSVIYLFLQSFKASLLGPSHIPLAPLIPFRNTTDPPRSVISYIADNFVLARRIRRLLNRRESGSHSRQGELDAQHEESV